MSRACEQSFLQGRVALVTGASRGLGRDLTLAVARAGADVAINYLRSRPEALEVAGKARDYGVQAEVFPADVRDSDAVRKLVAAVIKQFGQLDILVNNVGDYHKKHLLEVEPAEWVSIFESNLHSAFYSSQAVIPVMHQNSWGRILNIGFASSGQVSAEPWITAYHIAKTGLLTLTKSYAAVLASHGITVNMLSPGVLESSESKPLQEIPAGRLGRHGEMVDIALYLLAPTGDYITGTNIEVAGGWRL